MSSPVLLEPVGLSQIRAVSTCEGAPLDLSLATGDVALASGALNPADSSASHDEFTSYPRALEFSPADESRWFDGTPHQSRPLCNICMTLHRHPWFYIGIVLVMLVEVVLNMVLTAQSLELFAVNAVIILIIMFLIIARMERFMMRRLFCNFAYCYSLFNLVLYCIVFSWQIANNRATMVRGAIVIECGCI
jgi:hypothetical protein